MTELMPMSEIKRTAEGDDPVDEAELAAAAFLARYQGRTLEAYRYDLRAFFQWAADDRLDILKATRPQIELYVRAMECPRPGRHHHRPASSRRLRGGRLRRRRLIYPGTHVGGDRQPHAATRRLAGRDR